MAQKQHPSFSDVFSAVAPNVFRAKESFEDDIVELEAGLKDLVTVETVNFPVSETSATAALDGGFVFREVQIDDDPLRQADVDPGSWTRGDVRFSLRGWLASGQGTPLG